MNRNEIVARFNRLYLGDSVLQQLVLCTADAQCQLRFNIGRVLKDDGASIFDPKAKFEPALLRLDGVECLDCESGPYHLNSTVVDFGAMPSGDGELVEFYFSLTGGRDPESFMVKLRIVARDFEIGGVEPQGGL